jgi:hypothetical protein
MFLAPYPVVTCSSDVSLFQPDIPLFMQCILLNAVQPTFTYITWASSKGLASHSNLPIKERLSRATSLSLSSHVDVDWILLPSTVPLRQGTTAQFPSTTHTPFQRPTSPTQRYSSPLPETPPLSSTTAQQKPYLNFNFHKEKKTDRGRLFFFLHLT